MRIVPDIAAVGVLNGGRSLARRVGDDVGARRIPVGRPRVVGRARLGQRDDAKVADLIDSTTAGATEIRRRTLGLTEVDQGRDEYATSAALGVVSSEMAAAAVRTAAAGAAELAAATAMGGLAEALANDSTDRPAEAKGAVNPAKAAPANARATKPATQPSRKSAPRKPAKPSK